MTNYERAIAGLAKYEINCAMEASRRIRAITVKHIKSFIGNNYALQAIDKTEMYEEILEATWIGIAKPDIEATRINESFTPKELLKEHRKINNDVGWGDINWGDIFDLWKQARPEYMKDLSDKVWLNVELTRDAILAVVEHGGAVGTDSVEVARQLETFIKYKDGGRRVVGRWGRLESGYKEVNGVWVKDEEKIRKAWEKEYVKSGGEPRDKASFEKYLDENARDRRYLPGEGGLKLTKNMRDYEKRIGKAGLDYRAIRLERTEASARVAETQKEWARQWGTKKVYWKLEPEREVWHCLCEKRGNKTYDVDDPFVKGNAFPPHPNCRCHLVPEIPDWRDAETV
jgi:SPP1 gp7 family putative phage head morphogenesis protein